MTDTSSRAATDHLLAAAGFQVDSANDLLTARRNNTCFTVSRDDETMIANIDAGFSCIRESGVIAIGPDSYEHLVEPASEWSRRLLYSNQLRAGSGTDPQPRLTIGSDSTCRATLGPPTPEFVAACLRSPDATAHLFANLLRPWAARRGMCQPILQPDIRAFTIRIEGLGEQAPSEIERRGTVLMEALIFRLSIETRVTVVPLNNLEEPLRPSRAELPGRRRSSVQALGESSIPFASPPRIPLRFYLFGASSDIPALQYLSFYQVIEFYFYEVVDERLTREVRKRLLNPSFSPDTRSISALARQILALRASYDETEMLRDALEQYIDPATLTEVVTELESQLGEKWFTRKRDIFGIECQLDLNVAHVFSSVAKRIKAIRNALAHAREKYEGEIRHVPYSSASGILLKELPLLRWIAEEFLIANSQPMEWVRGQ